MRGNRLYFLFATICAISATAGAADEVTAKFQGKAFLETYREQAPVSGNVVAGLSLVGFGPGANPISLLVPDRLAGQSVCVQVVSRDGRYWSQNTFALPARLASSTVDLEYPSDYTDYLTSLSADQLAVRVARGECGKEQPRSPLIASAPTSSAAAAQKKLLVYVNAGRADTYLVAGDGRTSPSRRRCRLIEQGRRTSFDTVCIVELGVFQPLPDTLSIRLLRRRYERAFPPTEFSVSLPGSR